ncbi:MAG: DSBA-like thioredoxin protein [Candidatus Saccharibacteria bacterium]|nr:DSBA-like thioredoxin protein [Candidatus Saccharibacteria bacterium]
MSKQFWAVIAVLIIAFAGVAVVSNKKDATTSSSGSAQPTSHVEGAGNKKVTLVEYGDFECPYCYQYHPTVKQVVASYGDDITFQFRNYPLTSLHQNAFAAARAAEAASLQGKFWDMHDLLYEDRSWVGNTSPAAVFDQFATELKLNVTKFKQDYSSDKVNDTVNADLAAGQKLDINGTPTFFINGKKVEIANSVDSFKKVIDAEIAKQPAAASTTNN